MNDKGRAHREAQARYQKKKLKKRELPAVKNKKRKKIDDDYYVGIDGEGQGRDVHVYVLLAASNIDGSKSWTVESTSWRDAWDDERKIFSGYVQTLPTLACLDFYKALPKRAKPFAYSFNYDLTKQLEDLPNNYLYYLSRPDLRAKDPTAPEEHGPPSLPPWKGYRLNLQGSKFSVSWRSDEAKKGILRAITYEEDGEEKKKIVKSYPFDERFTLWDLFKFFQSKFVTALDNWKVGTIEALERMGAMKSKRGEFDRESPDEVTRYCLEECMFMAQLAKKLIDAHDEAGIELKSFYGAGSTAAAILRKWDIHKLNEPVRGDMLDAVARAFVGGRFEISRLGLIDCPIFNYDISSAYPYQIYFLPCVKHGDFWHTKDRRAIEGKLALVHYGLDETHPKALASCQYWAPFPFRDRDGSICYPAISGGGWVYHEEFEAAARLWPHVQFREAWVYEKKCSCEPFRGVSELYLQRLKISKDAAGIVLKLGTNALYGKTAQSLGSAIFNNWFWAGLITSGCRGQLLRMMGQYSHLRNITMVATDGVFGTEQVSPLAPKPTGTDFLLTGEKNPKPLGGWELTSYEHGLFQCRPGIYYPPEPNEKTLKGIKGRGVGRDTILRHHRDILKSWALYGDSKTVIVGNVDRFCGMKSCISKREEDGKIVFDKADGSHGPDTPRFGNWIKRSIEMSFNPMPKRARVLSDGSFLEVRKMPADQSSAPYSKAILSKEALEMKAATLELMEQPDFDWADYGLDEEGGFL